MNNNLLRGVLNLLFFRQEQLQDAIFVFRLNIGISKQTFQALFGTPKVDINSYDFTALDVIMPHPDYAQQHFICVLSPSEATFERLGPLLAEAYDIAVRRYTRQNKNK